MPMLVLTVVGEDRSGLVAALAKVVTKHDGNWERSELADIDGTFAGVVEISVPAEKVVALTAALKSLDGMLKITTRTGITEPTQGWPTLTVSVIGNDRPGIIKEIAGALSAHRLNIQHLASKTTDAPMAGGRLFEATVMARMPAAADTAAIRADLEKLAAEIQVDLNLS